MNLSIALKSEILKTKRTASWYFVVLLSIAVSAIFVLTVSSNDSSHQINPWVAIFNEEFKSLNLLVLPMFTILVCTLLPQIEYSNNTWKQLLASPQRFMHIYLSKFLVVQLLILIFLSLFLLSAGFCTVLYGFANPSLKLFNYSPDWNLLAVYAVKTYLSVLSLSAIQYILGLTMKSFVAPIATGFILWMLGNLLIFEMHSALANFFPYSFSTMVVFPKYEVYFPTVVFTSIGLSVVCLVVGYLFFRKVMKHR